MRVIFKSIKLQNFMSYQSEEVALNRHGFILVSGINNNPVDNAKSNGTGKSSLFSAISWALTGLTVGGGKEVANIYLSGTTSVELFFSVDNVEYQIHRTKNPSNLKIYVNGMDKSGKGIRDTEKILAEYIPDLTHTLLNSVIILGQGLPQRFTNNTPSGRKEVLENLSNSDFMISDLKFKVSTRIAALKELIRTAEDNITSATAKQELITGTTNKLNQELNLFTKEQYDHLTAELLNNQTLLSEYNDIIVKNDASIKQTLDNISSINTILSENLVNYEKEKLTLPLKNVDEITHKLIELETTIKTLKNEIKKLDSITDVCPTCGQKLPNVTKIDTSAKHAELQNLNLTVQQLQQQRNEYINYNTSLVEEFDYKFDLSQHDIKQQFNALNEKLNTENEIKNKNIIKLNEIQKQQNTIEIKINNFTSKKLEITQKLTEYTEQLNVLQNKIVCYNNDVDELQKHLEVVSKMSTMLSRDFRGYLLQHVINYISNRAKQYTYELFGTDKLEFKLEGNNIEITYDSKDYEVLSGGEKQKVDVIVQLAIRDMLCKYLNFTSNILVLDEITDSLDITGSQQMFNLISTKLNDVEAVYIISHHQDDFEIPYDDQINIVKGEDKISRILM